MLDPKILRKDTAQVIQNLKRRGYVFDESLWNELEEKRKKLQGFTEAVSYTHLTLPTKA